MKSALALLNLTSCGSFSKKIARRTKYFWDCGRAYCRLIRIKEGFGVHGGHVSHSQMRVEGVILSRLHKVSGSLRFEI